MSVFDAKCRKFVVYFVCFAALTKGEEGDSIGIEPNETFPYSRSGKLTGSAVGADTLSARGRARREKPPERTGNALLRAAVDILSVYYSKGDIS